VIPGEASLTSLLGHEFALPELLRAALTHRSAAKQKNNERLEFLGDAVVGLIIAEELFRRFPDAREGELTRLRAMLVNREYLAKLGKARDIGPLITLGPGERKSGGWRRTSIIADAMEAVIGAIFLDAGMAICRERVLELYREALDNISLSTVDKDPKTRLQEWLQSRQAPLPTYKVIDISGAAHDQNFSVECQVTGVEQALVGHGSSIKRAEQAAAESALEMLGVDGNH